MGHPVFAFLVVIPEEPALSEAEWGICFSFLSFTPSGLSQKVIFLIEFVILSQKLFSSLNASS